MLPKQTDFTAPTITTVTGPPAQSTLTTATFTYRASESGVTFSCKLDSDGFRLCQRRYEGLAAGPHTLVIKATDGAGNTGPAKVYNWAIVGKVAPVRGTMLLGVKGPIPYFDRQTGQHSTVGLVIVGWDQGAGWGSPFSRPLQDARARCRCSASSTGRNGKEAITPRQIAQGKGDGYLIALNGAINAWGRRIYIRPFAEMNGYWNLLLRLHEERRGEAEPLHRGLPARVRAGLPDRPRRARGDDQREAEGARDAAASRAIFRRTRCRTPASSGTRRATARRTSRPTRRRPTTPATRTSTSSATISTTSTARPTWDANEKLYNAHPNKPYAFPEWGLWGIDDPAFVRAMGTFVRTHRRTEVLLYYQGQPGSVFDLEEQAEEPRRLPRGDHPAREA